MHGDVLLIVPPFALLNRPSLASHLLQACAGEQGFRVVVCYANLHLAADASVRVYETLCDGDSPRSFLCDRFFSRAAFGMPLLGRNRHAARTYHQSLGFDSRESVTWPDLERAASGVDAWVDRVASAVAGTDFPVVAATTTFSQSAAAIALLGRIKQLRPDILTLLGGANCEGVMAEGIASAAPWIDYVFSGESERAFPRFLKQHRKGDLPSDRIVRGEPCPDLDRLPCPEYGEFFEQLAAWLPDTDPGCVWLPYETSRGCWWGERRRCTFCGLNGLRVGYRERSPDRVREDLASISDRHPGCRVAMTDNVMPRSYFETLYQRLDEDGLGLKMFCEQRPGLSLDDVIALRNAGVTAIQAGVEALSPSLLKRMSKGFSVDASIRLLRYARSVKMGVLWNLLYGIPGDRLEEYEETLALLPLLRHLAPCSSLGPIRLDRFSRYVENSEDFGIRNLKPLEEYANVYPPRADLRKLAYYLGGDYESESREQCAVIEEISAQVETAHELWSSGPNPPLLLIKRVRDNVYLLADTRGVCATTHNRIVDRDQALAALAAGPGVPAAAIEWALEHKVGVLVNSRYVPLATATPELIREFEEEASAGCEGVEDLLPLEDVLPAIG
jgi:ribosomal peptide maturation radical SAM protein 1